MIIAQTTKQRNSISMAVDDPPGSRRIPESVTTFRMPP